jgi:hypothetical protein
MKKVWTISGTAIRAMWRGLLRITSPWKEKRSTSVRSSPIMVRGPAP